MGRGYFDHTSYNDEEWSFNYRDEFEQFLSEFDIEKKEICLIGSTARHIAGLRINNDIDFIISQDIRERVKKEFNEMTDQDRKVYEGIDAGSLNASSEDRYAKFGISDEEILEDSRYHVVIDDYKVIRLELNFSAMLIAQLKHKNKSDFEIVRDNILSNENWDWDLTFVLPPWEIPSGASERKMSRRNRTISETIRDEGIGYTIKRGIQILRKASRHKITKYSLQIKNASTRPVNTITIKYIMRQKGPLNNSFYAVILPPAQQHREDILNILDEKVDGILSVTDYCISNNCQEFIVELFSNGDYVRSKNENLYNSSIWPPGWHIAKIHHEVKKYSGKISIIHFELDDPEFTYDEQLFSTTAIDLRDEIRKEYSTEIDNYTFDNIIYMSYNDQTTESVARIVTMLDQGYYE